MNAKELLEFYIGQIIWMFELKRQGVISVLEASSQMVRWRIEIVNLKLKHPELAG